MRLSALCSIGLLALLAAPALASTPETHHLPGGLTVTATVRPRQVQPGEQFHPTISVTNHGSAPVQVDFWLDVEPGRNPRVYLQTNTIPAGGTFTETYTNTVPLDTPPRVYRITVYVGDFATNTVLGEDAYLLRVLEPSRAASEPATSGVTSPAASVAASEVAVSPNPFEARTSLSFAVSEATDVRLAVYDVLGREVAVLVDGQVEAGAHTAVFDASSLAAGTYVYRLVAGTQVETGRLTVAR